MIWLRSTKKAVQPRAASVRCIPLSYIDDAWEVRLFRAGESEEHRRAIYRSKAVAYEVAARWVRMKNQEEI
jgi:hypothetical protein